MLSLLLATAEAIGSEIAPLARQYEVRPDPTLRAAHEADMLAEAVALDVLTSADVRVLSEEAGWVGNGLIQVVLDPIDGTENLTRGIPYSGPSIWAQNEDGICVGVVSNVFTGHNFWAVTASGAFRDGEQLNLVGSPGPGLLIVGGQHRPLSGIFGRDLGATAHSLCAVAEGRLAGYRTPSHCPDRSWDLMAGLLIAKEAGCRVRSIEGGKDPMHDPLSDNRVVVAPRLLFRHLWSLSPSLPGVRNVDEVLDDPFGADTPP